MVIWDSIGSWGLELLDPSSPLFILSVIFITLVIGDNIFFALGFAASQGYMKWWMLIMFFWAIVISDYPFYMIGRSKYFDRLKKVKYLGKFFERVDDTLDFITANHITLAFFYCKFISGAKPWINIYLGDKGVSRTRFIIMTLVAGIVWSIFAFFVGWFAGQGFTIIWEVFESLSIASLFLLIFIVLFYKFVKKAKHHIHEKYSSKNKKKKKKKLS
ncbi:MAG: hypothetical protein WD876_03300 [Candidatus Pacearchaeota archaeon]